MDLRNTKPKNLKDNKEDYEFQILDWYDYNEDLNESDSEEDDEDYNKKFIIRIFGVDKDNKSVSLKVKNFKPRFYLNIPNKFNNTKIDILINTIKSKVKKRFREGLIKYTIVKKKKFKGFTNNEKFKFVKFVFCDTLSLMSYMRVCERKIYNSLLSKKPKKYDLYESNIPAFLRFIHIKDIKTAGWLKLPKNKYTIIKDKETYSQRELEIKWDNVEISELNHISPLIVLSFDIECNSSHGDFPLAKKTYKKLANEMVDYVFIKKLYRIDNEDKNELINKLLNLAFINEKNIENISYCFTKNEKKPDKNDIKILVGKLNKLLFIKIERVLNNKDLRKAVEKTKEIWTLEQSLDLLKTITQDVGKEYDVDYKHIFKKILTRDILVDKITEILDIYLPKLEGDNVIQIGSTVHKYGENKCYLRHIVTLNTCNDIKNSIVISCKTEQEVLIEWCKFVRELDPDIITGYNIFGFDYKFIFQRAEELDCLYEMKTISRLKNKEIELIEKNLSSSALGENILTYLNTEGRVSLDLLKVIQKDHKLTSYKLDTVSETFINDSILNINENELEIKGDNDLEEGNYITIFFKNEKYLDGNKFQIKKKDGNKIYLDSKIEDIIDKNPKWRLAKDDIGPKDIFRLQDESTEGRTIVAKYCIQDCMLCNKLIMKLNIIANNIGMANVCSVPVSYIFLRGQGIKIFSLVAKECRENDFLIPVIKKVKSFNDKNNEEDDEEEGGYEGAIVLKPNPGIYFEPVTVLDYSSLYPSCMISENLSHDTIVLEAEYDNLKDHEYIDITYDVYEWIDKNIKSKGKKKTGEKTCRFVQSKDGKKGIIPQILQKLLKQRKYVRKEMIYKTIEYKTEDNNELFSGLIDKDTEEIIKLKTLEGESKEIMKSDIINIKDTYNEFEQEVKDGLQLAYKITANSLYGQIGAKTSQICLIDIAASTTATGRKLLHMARDKTEEKFDDAKVVYGDSIPNYELLKLKINNKIIVETVENIKNKYFEWINDEDTKKYYIKKKEYSIYTFTEKGLTDVLNIMEHKSKNDIIKIITTTGTVHVTDEHSIILKNGEVITPKDLKIGDCLLTCDKIKNKDNGKVIEIINLGKSDNNVYDLTTDNHHFQAGNGNIVVHNTDSIFINFNPKDKKGNKLQDKQALKKSIELGVEAEKYIQSFLKPPHKLEYEKTFYPFILFTKKRYIGNKYEFDLEKYKQTSMGIVLKRRDNAEIVKHVYGGIMNIIMKEKDIKKSIKFLNKELNELIKGKFPFEMLTITKCLKSYYKNPESIAHKVLADRIGEREPGNKPLPNDRIPYIYIENNNKNILQGDKIELPSYIIEHKLKPDYLFYITNQIKKPVSQIYALIVDKLENYNYDEDYLNRLYISYKEKHGETKANEKLTNKKNEIAGNIIFKDIERICMNKKNNIRPITDWFK